MREANSLGDEKWLFHLMGWCGWMDGRIPLFYDGLITKGTNSNQGHRVITISYLYIIHNFMDVLFIVHVLQTKSDGQVGGEDNQV